ncbi:hypothetical protein GLOTRDRAFT_127959 [Gloeophyllum trabeum ATCC 11539]|uniref:CBM1 domain-containing protein n=1 Tax=Gloeophyllum trabeum (strain ATCC 11539 / FP-39264 / Madison 617) TaxID=670483 RepID=S7QDW1_GLOTA|nr:uncharacterized protein GLOTRDRAFT_127959 [Gloeophyllum trabeum ATCC 11539]EPQ57602.1 hypothetical protein GLOTRDRAFT_127959 [Gloeophyllum trabeum ATCC 11539]
MKFFSIAIVPLVFAALASAQGPCYNQADPDNGIGNYCYCEGNGLCYTNPQGQCNPVGTQINCPE